MKNLNLLSFILIVLIMQKTHTHHKDRSPLSNQFPQSRPVEHAFRFRENSVNKLTSRINIEEDVIQVKNRKDGMVFIKQEV